MTSAVYVDGTVVLTELAAMLNFLFIMGMFLLGLSVVSAIIRSSLVGDLFCLGVGIGAASGGIYLWFSTLAAETGGYPDWTTIMAIGWAALSLVSMITMIWFSYDAKSKAAAEPSAPVTTP